MSSQQHIIVKKEIIFEKEIVLKQLETILNFINSSISNNESLVKEHIKEVEMMLQIIYDNKEQIIKLIQSNNYILNNWYYSMQFLVKLGINRNLILVSGKSKYENGLLTLSPLNLLNFNNYSLLKPGIYAGTYSMDQDGQWSFYKGDDSNTYQMSSYLIKNSLTNDNSVNGNTDVEYYLFSTLQTPVSVYSKNNGQINYYITLTQTLNKIRYVKKEHPEEDQKVQIYTKQYNHKQYLTPYSIRQTIFEHTTDLKYDIYQPCPFIPLQKAEASNERGLMTQPALFVFEDGGMSDGIHYTFNCGADSQDSDGQNSGTQIVQFNMYYTMQFERVFDVYESFDDSWWDSIQEKTITEVSKKIMDNL